MYPRYSSCEQRIEQPLSLGVQVCTAAAALEYAVQEHHYNHHFYYFFAGRLLPYWEIFMDREACYGGLDEARRLFVLVPVALFQQRRRACLLQLAREHLIAPTDEQISAYCDLIEREKASNRCASDHPVVLAEYQASQVAYWLEMMQREQ